MATKKELEQRIAGLEALVASLSAQVAALHAQPRLYIYPSPNPYTYPQITCRTGSETYGAPSRVTITAPVTT